MDTLLEVLIGQLKDLHSAETQLITALPKMAKGAVTPALKDAFETHLAQTEQHLRRLEQIGELLEISLTGKKCKAMEGLIEEGAEILKEGAQSPFRDIALVAAAQRVEHYEISGYGTARMLAEQLEAEQVAEILEQTLDEESETDELLTSITQGSIIPDIIAQTPELRIQNIK